RSRLPAEAARGSSGWVVIVVPPGSVESSIALNKAGSTAEVGGGARDPTGDGTETAARATMSVTLATTVGRRTSLGPYHGCDGMSPLRSPGGVARLGHRRTRACTNVLRGGPARPRSDPRGAVSRTGRSHVPCR